MTVVQMIATYINEAGPSVGCNQILLGKHSGIAKRKSMDPDTVDYHFDLNSYTPKVTVAKIVAFCMVVSRSANQSKKPKNSKAPISVLVKTNSITSPDNTFTISPNFGLHWPNPTNPYTMPFTSVQLLDLYVTAIAPPFPEIAASFDFFFHCLYNP